MTTKPCPFCGNSPEQFGVYDAYRCASCSVNAGWVSAAHWDKRIVSICGIKVEDGKSGRDLLIQAEMVPELYRAAKQAYNDLIDVTEKHGVEYAGYDLLSNFFNGHNVAEKI